jgi:hypothetical protein
MSQERIFLFSLPLVGFIVPLLELDHHLAGSPHSVTFVSSHSKIPEIYQRNLPSPEYKSNNQIHLLGLEDGDNEHKEQASPSTQYFFDIAYRLDAEAFRITKVLPVENSIFHWNVCGTQESFDIVVSDFSLTA